MEKERNSQTVKDRHEYLENSNFHGFSGRFIHNIGLHNETVTLLYYTKATSFS